MLLNTYQDITKLIRKAIKISKRNYGCPGVDGIAYRNLKSDTAFHLKKIENVFYNYLDNARPRQISIKESDLKIRNVFVYSIYDRIAQQCVKILISKKINNNISNNVLSNKRGIDFEKIIKNLLSGSQCGKMVLKIDIENYYYSIKKELLYELLLKANIEHELVIAVKNSFSHCENGIPPGNVLSPMLASFYLKKIDDFIGNNFIRFGDDIYIFINSISEVKEVIKDISVQLESLYLRINEDKIKIVEKPVFEDFL